MKDAFIGLRSLDDEISRVTINTDFKDFSLRLLNKLEIVAVGITELNEKEKIHFLNEFTKTFKDNEDNIERTNGMFYQTC